MANHVLRCAMCLLILASSAQARWGAKSGGDKNSEDLVYELTSATFNLTLAAAPATWAMVEFYAHWYVHDAALMSVILCFFPHNFLYVILSGHLVPISNFYQKAECGGVIHMT